MKNNLEFILDGLCCSNCAMKIEKKVNDISLVKEANVNIATQILAIELKDGANKEEIHQTVEKIVKEIEPEVVVKEKVRSKKSKEATAHNKKGESHGHSHGDEHSHGEEHDHSHSQNHSIKNNLIRFGVSAIFFFAALIFDLPRYVELSLFLISYVISGGEVVLRAIKNIARGEIFDENFLMSIATIGAFIIGNYPEGVAVMLFYQVGELFQDYAVSKSRNSISSLMDIRPDYANLLVDNVIKVVSPEDIEIGSHIVVKPGEKIPLDGKIIEGTSLVDTTALTGESVPREVFVGDNVLSGFINTNGVLTIEVEKDFEDSTVSKILDLVENASNKKAPTEKFITKFARIYTPIVTISAFLLAIIPPLVIPSATFSEWVYRALIFLVISCPCALVVSIPLGFFGGIGGASKNGILIKGSNYLEVLNEVNTIVFDKTGTLTKGVFKVTEIDSKGELSQEELLECAAYAESYSNHPIALSIMSKYGKSVNQDIITDYEEVAGKGIKVTLNGKKVLAGNSKLMDDQNIAYEPVNKNGSIIHVSIEDVYAGYIIISDELKEDSKEAITKLKGSGIKNIVMLTGDTKKVGESVAKELGIDKVYTDLLPNEKVEKLEELISERKGKEKIMFVGDGINDAPVLALSDIGVAMGGLGSDAAKGASDMILTDDNFSTIVNAIEEGRNIYNNIKKAVIFLLSCNLGEVITILISILFSWPIPLLPTQILWINLITDSLPAIALGVDPGDKDVMKNKPRNPKESFFSQGAGLRAVIGGVLIGILTLIAFVWGVNERGYSVGSNIPEDVITYARTMSFVVLAASQLFYSLSMRNESKSIFQVGLFTNMKLVGAIIVGLFLQFVVISIPPLATAFGVHNLPLNDWIIVIVFALIPLCVNEIIKIFMRKKEASEENK